MSQILATPGTNATFDFFTNLITLKRIPCHEYWKVEDSLKNRDIFKGSGQEAYLARAHKADLVHEVTHFIDATTSLWGLEYNGRKTIAAQYLQGKLEFEAQFEQIMPVFMLNTTEIDAHKVFIKHRQSATSLSACSLRHRIVIDKNYGPLVLVSYWQNGEEILEVPVSMLAVLEAHAFANETLSRLIDAKEIADAAYRNTVLKQIGNAYAAALANIGTVEYTLFHRQLDDHAQSFPSLTLEHRLRILCAIVTMALNADVMQMSVFAQSLEDEFAQSDAGTSAALDMMRGASRAIFAFKSIQLFHDAFARLAPQEQNLAITEMSANCFGTVRKIMFDSGIWVDSQLGELEVPVPLGFIIPQGFLHDKKIIPSSVELNRSIVAHGTCADVFDRLHLPDAIDPTGKYCLRFPNRIDVTVVNTSKTELLPLTRLWARIEQQPRTRFFM